MVGRLKYLDDVRRASIDAVVHVDRTAYRRAIRRLESFKFWEGRSGVLSLWEHQRSAIALGVAYMNAADRRLPQEGNVTEAALLKLPTGTGKSGIVAVLVRCIPQIRRVLVLTPRIALTDQLKADIEYRFWRNIGFQADEGKIWSAPASIAGADVPDAVVESLLPNVPRLTSLLSQGDAERIVLVATFQAFDRIRRDRDRLERKLRREGGLNAENAERLRVAKEFLAFLSGFDLIVVDEGHYEPAPSWSRSVRLLDRPTILLSATPFRNDYKLFQVRGRFVYNLPFFVARERNIVRSVEFASGHDRPGRRQAPPQRPRRPTLQEIPAEEGDRVGPIRVTQEDRDEVRRFVALLGETMPAILERARNYTEKPKIMVRAGSFEVLFLLQKAIETQFGERPVLVHERINKPAADDEGRRYQMVAVARERCPGARFWLHETKLLEGIDEPEFVAVAIYDPFTNARQLIQQIGRAIRSTDPKRRSRQMASVVVFPEMRARIERSWDRYLEFENYCAENLQNVVPSEAFLPEKIVQQIPDTQYVDGEFRQRLPGDVLIAAEDLMVPLRASVFLIEPSFDLEDAALEIHEAIVARNRFVVREIEGLPENAIGWTYFGVRESPYLVKHFMTEWVMGLFLGARIGPLFLVQDTDGVVFDPTKVDLERAGREHLLRMFADHAESQVTITRMSAHSLDMSDRAIRTLSARTRSFAETFTDLLDPILVPTSVYGFVEGNGRYLGIKRGRISDASDSFVPIVEYLEWVQRIAADLTDQNRRPNSVFDRYARLADVGDREAARPTSILLDLSRDAFREFGVSADADAGVGDEHDLPYEDVCAEVNHNGEFSILDKDGQAVACRVQYNRETGRYKITSPLLDERHPPRVRERSTRAVALTEWINREQAFRLTIPQNGVVYMQGEFHQTQDFVTDDGTVLPLEDVVAVPFLGETMSEKGEGFFDDTGRWEVQSVFGSIKAFCEGRRQERFGPLTSILANYDLVLLDDGSDEIADFVAVGDRRVALIHAKASEILHYDAITPLQAVGRQAMASLAFCSTLAQVDGIAEDRWRRPYRANQVTLDLSRVFKNGNDVPDEDVATSVKAAFRNPTFSKEIWVLAGRLVAVEHIRQRAQAGELSNRQRQLLMFIESLRTACGRANARLRIFGHSLCP
jgi:superfamily II DNA or RNA helicase